MKTLAVAALSLAGLAGLAQADIFSGGSGGNLVDALGNNSPASSGLASFTLPVTGVVNGSISSFNSLTITMGHSWVGDLVVTLTSPAGTVADVLVRPGVTTATGFGSGANLGSSSSGTAPGTAAYTFVLSGGMSLLPAPASGVHAAGTYNVSPAANLTVVAPGTSGLSFAAFNGQNVNGTWTLNIRDMAAGDTGTVASWSMDISTVPTPGAAAMLGLGGLAATRRRRA